MKRYWGSWLVFLAVGGIMGALRYGNFLPADYLSMLRDYGPWVILGVYVCLILFAFKDTVYQGVLALLIPLYPFYYLFMISDAFYIRALVAGLLVGLGQDSAVFLQAHLTDIVDTVRGWIASGG